MNNNYCIDISFKKGDIVEIVATRDQWLYVDLNGTTGIVPSNYFGPKTKDLSTLRLQKQTNGTPSKDGSDDFARKLEDLNVKYQEALNKLAQYESRYGPL
jgi:hypothetical protein